MAVLGPSSAGWVFSDASGFNGRSGGARTNCLGMLADARISLQWGAYDNISQMFRHKPTMSPSNGRSTTPESLPTSPCGNWTLPWPRRAVPYSGPSLRQPARGRGKGRVHALPDPLPPRRKDRR